MFLLAAANLYRAIRTVEQLAYLQGLGLTLPPAYLAGGSLAWGMLFVTAGGGLWRTTRWGRRLTLASVSLYQVHIWINHFVFDASDYARMTWPFHALVSLSTLACVWGLLLTPGVRRLFS